MTAPISPERLCEQIVSGSQAAVIFADEQGIIRLWNSGSEAMFGFTAAEALGVSMDIIIPERHRPKHWEGYRKVMTTGVTRYGTQVLAVPAVRKDGQRLSIEFTISLLRSPEGKILGAAAVVQDVTARWQREKELRSHVHSLEEEVATLRQKVGAPEPAGSHQVICQRVAVSSAGGREIPGVLMAKTSPCGGAVLLHPYGGSKEHMLGLAMALAEAGWAALSVDLCGHGENRAEIGVGICQEVEATVAYMHRFGPTAAIGLSLGGRLALMSSAERSVAISPAVVAEVSPQGKWMFENFPSPAVREPYAGYVVELLEALGPVRKHDRPCLILYAERDIPAILKAADELKSTLSNAEVRYITSDLRPDVQHDNGFIRYLPRWFNHNEMKFNNEVIQATASWLAQVPVTRALGA